MVTCPVCNRRLGNMQIRHLKTHGYGSWEEFLTEYPTFEDTEWKEHSQKAAKIFWDNVTSDQIAERKEKQLNTWYSASEEELKERKVRRSVNTAKVWSSLTSLDYEERCHNIGNGYVQNTTKEQRTRISLNARNFLPEDQAYRCSQGMKEYWSNLTDEEYFEICEKRSQFWEQMPGDEYQAKCAKFKNLWESRSAEEKAKLKEIYISNIKKSFGSKESWIEKSCRQDLEAIGFEVKTQFSSLLVDVYVPSLNLAIELYGTFWHCDPRWFTDTDIHPVRGLSAQEIWEKDYRKQQQVIKNHHLLVLWESDYSFENLFQNIRNLNLSLARPTDQYGLWTSLTSINLSPKLIEECGIPLKG